MSSMMFFEAKDGTTWQIDDVSEEQVCNKDECLHLVKFKDGKIFDPNSQTQELFDYLRKKHAKEASKIP
jgi:hypothetical protein